ncbi:MAG: Bax inhibitor-1/YccA family protein [Micrococcaceae bacterium]
MNPVLNNQTFSNNNPGMHTQQNQSFSQAQFGQMPLATPSATSLDTGRMTYNDVIAKTAMSLGIVIVGALLGFVFPGIGMAGMFGGLVLGLYLSFSRKASASLTMVYALCQGLFAGGLSAMLEPAYPGVVSQALIGTISIFVATLVLYRSGKFRTNPKMNRIFTVGMWGMIIFGLINFVMMMTGLSGGTFGYYSTTIPGTSIPMGIFFGLASIAMGAYSLVQDFEIVDYGVKTGAPKQMGWVSAFGITLTMVWMYTELLRLLSILQDSHNN